jgi:peptidyl-prolyl cis-trans isomerase D
MTILSSIRSRIGLIIGIIFLALLAFVLTDLFDTRSGILGSGGSNDVGEINGNAVTYAEFQRKIAEVEEQRQGQSLSEQELTQYQDYLWQENINKYIYDPQYDMVGVSVTDDELADAMYSDSPSPILGSLLSDRQTGKVYEPFADPMTQQLSGAKVREYVSKMNTPEQETSWRTQVEDELRKMMRREKYNVALRKGLYVTRAQAKREYNDDNTKYNYKYTVKKYSEVADSTVKVTDEEMQAYYKQNPHKFKQREDSREIEFVAFDIMPSVEDIAGLRANMEKLLPTFKSQKSTEDSLFVLSNSTNSNFERKYMYPGQFPAGSDSAFLKAAKGDVLGPFSHPEGNDNVISLYKVIGQKFSSDSCKVRHILVAYAGPQNQDPTMKRTLEESKKRADSLQRAIKGGKKMEDLVEKFTDDPGSKTQPGSPTPGNKGDYGWITEQTGFVQEFKDAGFNNKVGDVVVVKTVFGYHVIQVLEQTKLSKKVQVIPLDQIVEASQTTITGVYNKASEFAGKNNTGELFAKATVKEGMNVQKAGDITLNSRFLTGIESPKDIIRWVYSEDTKKGSVSDPFQNGERFLVCHVSKALEKGTKPFEEVREICELEARKIKKAQMFTDQFNKVKGTTLDQWASKAGTTVMPGAGVSIGQPYIQGAGYEGAVIGKLTSMKPGTVSEPIKGTMGVYIITLEAVTPPAEPLKDEKGQQARTLQNISGRVDGAATEILKDEAEIIDNRGKFF